MKTNYRILLVVLGILFSSAVMAQKGSIKGKVVDDMSSPLPGANVIISGTTKGTTTDFDGNFLLENIDSGNYKIEISSIGFVAKNVNAKINGNQIDLGVIQLMSSTESLSEVVVTALGIKREKKAIGYATQNLDLTVVEEVVAPNSASLFTGQVSGLTVNNPTGLFQAPNFSLRGKKPLIVVDGIPVETDFFDVSSNDIASLNVLKGPAAAALYGTRGKNGALIITTKGAENDGLQISVTHNTLVSAGFTVFPEFQKEYGNGSNGKYEFWDGNDGGISDGDMIWGPKFGTGIKVPQWNSPILDNVTGETIPWWGDVSGTKYDDKSRYSRVPIAWEYHDNLKNFLGIGIISNTNFSVANRGEKGSFRVSGNYKSQKGQVPNSNLKTGGLSFKSNSQLTENLSLDTKLSYNKVYSPNYPRHGYGPKNHMYTLLVWMGDDVNGEDLRNHLYVPGQEGYRQANWNYAWYNNAYFSAYELNQEYDEDIINSQLKLGYKFTDNLSLQLRGNAVIKDKFEDRESPKTYLNYGDPREGDYKTWNTSFLSVDYDLLLNFNKNLTDKIGLDVNLGASQNYRKFQREYNATDGLIVPFVYSLNNSQRNVKASTFLEKEALQSAYGSVEFDFNDAIFLTLTGRNDWSSTLKKENRSYFYPSVSVSTIVSKLVELPDFVRFLKVYGSWVNVNGVLKPYNLNSYYQNSGSFAGTPQLSYPSNIVNPNIIPSETKSLELGLSSSLFKGKLNFDFTYYNTKDNNAIIDLPVSLASGFDKRKVNGNEYTTNGFEVAIGAKPIMNDNFKWNLNLNWSTRATKLTEIYGNQKRFGNLFLNERVDSYYARVWQKSPDGRVIINSSGLPIKDSYKQNLGHLDPKWRLGLQNSFKYKDWTLNVGIDGAWGGLMRSLTVEKMWWGGKHPYSTEYRDEEYAAGKPIYVADGVNIVSGELTRDVDGNVVSDTRVFKENTNVVSWQTWSQNYPYRAQVTEKESKKFANVFDRTFFKLRSVNLKYDLTNVLNLKNVNSIDVNFNGYNLLIWKKADIIDPDFGNDNSLQDPSTRYIGLGLNVKF